MEGEDKEEGKGEKESGEERVRGREREREATDLSVRSAKSAKDHQSARRRADSSQGADQEMTSTKCRMWWIIGARGIK